MNDLFNGWLEDGEPVLTMGDKEMVEWCNQTQDTIIAQRKVIERYQQAIADAYEEGCECPTCCLFRVEHEDG
jgi:hypothetical protein